MHPLLNSTRGMFSLDVEMRTLSCSPATRGHWTHSFVCVVFITLPTLRYLSVTSNIVTFLYVEWKRRESQNSAAAAASASASASAGAGAAAAASC